MHRRLLPVTFLLLSLTAAACGGPEKPQAKPTPTSTPSPTATPTAVPSPVALNPLTGLPGGVGSQALAVKIDNTAPSHPQQGVEYADVVYLEEVEGGLTRLCAVFSTTKPLSLGPVRSVRETDLELLAPYGRVAFAFSGGNRGVLRAVRAAYVTDVSFDAVPPHYRRVGRPAPYNLFTNPQKLLAARPKSAVTRDVGFRFGELPAAGESGRQGSVRFQRASAGWTYDAATGRYLLSMDGRPDTVVGGTRLAADNVIVQFVSIQPSRFRDVNGITSPITRTIGSGPMLYFRDGQLFRGTWARSGKNATSYKDSAGKAFPLKAGKTWVMLVRKGSPVASR